ncbi:MAG: hypothetical protein ABIR63_06735 [Sphingomicrobium sp.]
MSAGRTEERRKLERKQVMLAGTLERLGHAVPVRVVNLSPFGATVTGGDLPQRNARVELHRNGKHMRGRMSWESNDRAGIHFEEACDVPGLLRTIAVPRRGYSETCRRPSLKPERVSESEQASIERCAALLGTAIFR